MLLAFLTALVACRGEVWDVGVDFSNITSMSRTVTTLQVVSNPILDRELEVNGTKFKNPIHDQAWASLAALEADLVRYVPWYPYPHVSVAELTAPVSGSPTSWNFSYILPMLLDFLNSTAERNHSTVINFSTQPCWLFGDSMNKTQNCSFPANPDESFFGYVRGDRANLLDPTSKMMSEYYARLLSWLILGEFTDETGVKHTGGPAVDLSAAKGHVWELFNEGEHKYTLEQYIHDYDIIVPAMISAVGADRAPKFMGIGGAKGPRGSPSWIPGFLDKSRHTGAAPVDYVSQHFYAGCSNRTDPDTFTDFFSRAASFISEEAIPSIAAVEASDFPNVVLDFDEVGVIMPDDNDPSFGIDANLPSIYWNAAAAMYAYLFTQLAPLGHGIVLGHSQLAGSPKIPEWGIPLPQYPSVSLLDWRTGLGNARYWALKLLIEEFGPGDRFVGTTATQGTRAPVSCKGEGQGPFCGVLNGMVDRDDYGKVVLTCCESTATIDSVGFADWGTPSGSCGAFKASNCSSANQALAWVESLCLGKRSCTLKPYPELGDPCSEPIKRFAVQVQCTGSKGGTSTPPPEETFPGLVAVGAIGKGTKKVLLVNTQYYDQEVAIKTIASGTSGDMTVRVVDPTSVQEASADGIREFKVSASADYIALEPWSVAVVTLDGGAAQ